MNQASDEEWSLSPTDGYMWVSCNRCTTSFKTGDGQEWMPYSRLLEAMDQHFKEVHEDMD